MQSGKKKEFMKYNIIEVFELKLVYLLRKNHHHHHRVKKNKINSKIEQNYKEEILNIIEI